jgi:hypothetical protein
LQPAEDISLRIETITIPARITKDLPNSVWGIEISTQELPSMAFTYDRHALEAALQSVKVRFAEDALACLKHIVIQQGVGGLS